MHQAFRTLQEKVTPSSPRLHLMDKRSPLSVSELNASIRTLLESRFPFVSVSGEISNLHRPHSGHLYFTLKDRQAQIRAVFFKTQQRYLAEQPADGRHVVCHGRISVYEPRGEYQLIVDTIDFHGAGALQQAFEELKQRLAAEGLFALEHKRRLPVLPAHITLITSPRGAAVHDFIRIASRRWPPIRIAVYPVSVQGSQAAPEMCAALAAINRGFRTDLIVLCRGGGSLEDLWAYNDEQLARAIRTSAIPVVSAVGHEIDFTIADLAADLRAPTPSAAAELLTPDGLVLRRQVTGLGERLHRTLRDRLDRYRARLLLARRQLEGLRHPLDTWLLHVDQLGLRLELSVAALLSAGDQQLADISLRLARCSPQIRLQLRRQEVETLHCRLRQAMQRLLLAGEERLERTAAVMHAVSPMATLARGYAVVRRTDGTRAVVTRASQVKIGEMVEVLLHGGSLGCRVEAGGRDRNGRKND